MTDAAEYLAFIKARIVVHPRVARWVVVREEAQGDLGLLRYWLTLRGGDLLEVFERFQVVEGSVQVTKYSFHWQDAAGQLLKRWDNAAHHPEVLRAHTTSTMVQRQMCAPMDQSALRRC